LTMFIARLSYAPADVRNVGALISYHTKSTKNVIDNVRGVNVRVSVVEEY